MASVLFDSLLAMEPNISETTGPTTIKFLTDVKFNEKAGNPEIPPNS